MNWYLGNYKIVAANERKFGKKVWINKLRIYANFIAQTVFSTLRILCELEPAKARWFMNKQNIFNTLCCKSCHAEIRIYICICYDNSWPVKSTRYQHFITIANRSLPMHTHCCLTKIALKTDFFPLVG